MGELHYGMNNSVFEFEDRLLHHLKLVIANKLRKGESFLFTWQTSECGAGSSLWLHPSIPLHFTFANLVDVEINKEWAELLGFLANRPGGLTIVDEPTPEAAQQP
ncbi:hypothetical protein ACIFOC_00206 [Leucobacter aridicollis]|uniref:DUF7882 family protein n=1 Tax=Leucobacter aridicollis TaxID=283878 RepID=UPI000EB1A1A9|nr:hypothetical protein [Leucobacter aridicollis]MCS3426545.1 hypothetical protein [Leucobacter aridicollis]RKQ89304.1 hypothetical protein U746_1634 [Mycolicibacterium mucogenicum 261Sha1.1M5]